MSVTGAQWAELTDALKAQTEATTTALTTQAKAQRRLESLRVAGCRACNTLLISYPGQR